MKIALRLFLLTLPVALLSACGGGTGNDATGTSPPPITLATSGSSAMEAVPLPALPAPQSNGQGAALTFSTHGVIDTKNPFFKPLGNGRACASCHQQSEGWTIAPQGLATRFENSQGLDPVFRAVDGANSPDAPTRTLEQKRQAYSMLLTKGLIRVGLPVPAGAEFTLTKSDDPYHFASAKELSLFRRPLPSTNLKFISSVMWDARETFSDDRSTICIAQAQPARCFASVDFDLLHQANSAVRGHAEAAQDLSALEQRAIVDFEKTLFTAQIVSKDAGSLTEAGALGGPAHLADQDFYFGINDIDAGDYRSGAPFNRNAMTSFAAWLALATPPPPPPVGGRPPPPPLTPPTALDLARASVARGEQLFNTRPFNITGVAGFSDELHLPLQRGTCTSCHSTPNSGTHSVPRQFNTGVSDGKLRTPDLPLYTLRNNSTGEVVETSDPGNALVTGKWNDVGRVKVPNLRAMAARPPYFHNGSAKEIEDVVRFYDRRFQIGFTPREAADLAAFLKVL